MICPAKVTRKYDILVSDAVFMYFTNWYVNEIQARKHKFIFATKYGGVV